MNTAAMKDPTAYLKPEDVDRMEENARMISSFAPRGHNPTPERILIRILFRTGIRISEAINIRVKDILFSEREIVIRRLKKRSEVWARLPLDSSTIDLIQQYLTTRPFNESEWLFPSMSKPGEHINRYTGYIWVRKAAEKAGIKEVGLPHISKYRHPHPHHLRHSLAKHYIKTNPGIDSLVRLQAILGHSSFATTASYLSYSQEEIREDYDRLWAK